MSNFNQNNSNKESQRCGMSQYGQMSNWAQHSSYETDSLRFKEPHNLHSFNIPAQNQFCDTFRQPDFQTKTVNYNRELQVPSYYNHLGHTPSASFNHGPNSDAYPCPPPPNIPPSLNYPPPPLPPNFNEMSKIPYLETPNFSSSNITETNRCLIPPPKDVFVPPGTNYVTSTKDFVLPSIRNYENIESKNESSHVEIFDNEENWLQQWTERVKLKKQNIQTSNLKIIDVQQKFLEYSTLMEELETIHKYMRETGDAIRETDWKNSFTKSEKLKVKLESLKMLFNAKNMVRIKNVINRRRNKRKRSRIVKKLKRKEWNKVKMEWKEKEIKIDAWRNKLNEEQLAKIQENKIKKEADSILHEVRTKQEESLKMQKLVEVLIKLRETRLKKGDVHGFTSSASSNEYFKKVTGELKNLLDSQLKQYHLEEQTLRVMMEESPKVLSLASKKSSNESSNLEKYKKQIYELLFGEKIPLEKQSDFQRSFTANEESLEILIKRRIEWDQFIVEEPSSLSSSIPLGWVVPNLDPHPDWKTFLLSKV